MAEMKIAASEGFSSMDKHWDMSVATLMRVHNSLLNINREMDTTRDPLRYATYLDTLFTQLYPFFKGEKRTEAVRLKNKVAEESNRLSANAKVRRGGSRQNLFKSCRKFHLFMMDVLYDQDLLMHKPEDTSHKF